MSCGRGGRPLTSSALPFTAATCSATTPRSWGPTSSGTSAAGRATARREGTGAASPVSKSPTLETVGLPRGR